ncbi:MAG: prepilin-type N-terminal cleavage/methylation domain-containing protein [bacterium]|nr:prepilin-type N-terminal cleavage/methylation domain-containing protein [bacterium]
MKGFTLIELLVTIAIIGILAATAIPQYSQFKKRAFDSRARSDLTHVAIAEEAYFLDGEKYLSCTDSSCINIPGVAAISDGVTLTINASVNSFTGTASHQQGSGKIFRWDSDAGGLMN